MTTIELSRKCANTGNGKIRLINDYNKSDTADFSGLSELEANNYLSTREVLYWNFVPIKHIDNDSWEFVLEIAI